MCLAFIVHIFNALMGSSVWCRWDGREEHSSSATLKNQPSSPSHTGNFALLKIRECSQSHLRHHKNITSSSSGHAWMLNSNVIEKQNLYLTAKNKSKGKILISDYYIFQDAPSQQWRWRGKVEWDWQKHVPWERFPCFLARIKDLSSLHLTWWSCVNLMQHVVFCHMVMDAHREFQFMKISHAESDVFLAPMICFLPSCFHQLLDFPSLLDISPVAPWVSHTGSKKSTFSFFPFQPGTLFENPWRPAEGPTQQPFCCLTDRRAAGQPEWRRA